jgi:hypothetical protein
VSASPDGLRRVVYMSGRLAISEGLIKNTPAQHPSLARESRSAFACRMFSASRCRCADALNSYSKRRTLAILEIHPVISVFSGDLAMM